jgi:hypothetical protein
MTVYTLRKTGSKRVLWLSPLENPLCKGFYIELKRVLEPKWFYLEPKRVLQRVLLWGQLKNPFRF